MRILFYKDQFKKTCIWQVPDHIGQVWDIFIETNKIKKTPNHIDFCQFLTVLYKVRKIFPEKF